MRLKHLLLLLAAALVLPITASAQTYPNADPNDPLKYDIDANTFVKFHNGLLYKFEKTNEGNIATILNTMGMIFSGFYPAGHTLYGAQQYYSNFAWNGKHENVMAGNNVWLKESVYDEDDECDYDYYRLVGDLNYEEQITVGTDVYTVAKVEAGAFRGHGDFKSEKITLPASVNKIETQTISETAFGLSEMPTPVLIENASYLFFNNAHIKTFVAPTEILGQLNGADFAHCTQLETITTSDNPEATGINIPATVTAIVPYEFLNCTAITNITLPNTVQKIERSAFRNTKLANVSIPATVTEVGNLAFGTATLKTVEINATSVENYDGGAFYDRDNFASPASIYALNLKKEDLAKFADAVKAYAVRDVRNLTANNFGTVCLGYDGVMPDADVMDIYEVVSANYDGETLKYITIDATTDSYLVAGKAYIFKAKVSRENYAFEREADSEVILNNAKTEGVVCLHGALDPTSVDGAGDVYMFQNNQLVKAASGSSCGANRAYLVPSDFNTTRATRALSAKAMRMTVND